jgi:hypothetical protein
MGINDYRKHTINLILAPYLLHIRKYSPDQTYEILSNWLNKCKRIRSLDFNIHSKIRLAIKTALRDKILPMKFETLRKNNKALYDILKTKTK